MGGILHGTLVIDPILATITKCSKSTFGKAHHWYESVILEMFNIGTYVRLFRLVMLGFVTEISNNNLYQVVLDMNNCWIKLESTKG